MGSERVDEQLGALARSVPYLSIAILLAARKKANYETVSDTLNEFESS